MKKIARILIVLFFFGLANCSDLKKGLGFEKDVPNEFLIKKNNPIVMPPTYDLLPPDSKSKKKTSKKSSDDNIKSIIDNSLSKNSQNSKKNNTKVESQSDLENTILKELSK